MAFLNPVVLLYRRQHCAPLVRSFAPAVLQAVGRVLVSTTSGPSPLESSGPVRYVRKPLPDSGTEGQRGKGALETEDSGSWRSGRALPSDGERKEKSESESEPLKKRSTSSGPPRRKGPRSYGGSDLSQASLRAEVRKSIASPNSSRTVELEEGRGFGATTRPERVYPGEYFSEESLETEETQVGKARGPVTGDDPRISARNYAIALLSRGSQTCANLRNKMSRRKIPAQLIDEIIDDLQRCGLQSDEEYAELFARSRWTDNTWGPIRIRLELLRRGVSEETVEGAVANLFNRTRDPADGIKEHDEEAVDKWGMSAEAASHLYKQARKRWVQGARESRIDTRRRRMIGWLQRRGFPWDTIQDILKTVESDDNSL